MSDWNTLLEGPLTGQWSYSGITDFNVFRLTLTNPINLASIAIAQAEVGAITQLFDLQRLGIRSESEICVIQKPPFFSDRRLAIRGIPFASNKSVSGQIKIEGMSMAIVQASSGFSSGWTRQGNQLISPVMEMLLSFDGGYESPKTYQPIPEGCLVDLLELQYALKYVGSNLPATLPAQLDLEAHLAPGQSGGVFVSKVLFDGITPANPNVLVDDDSPTGYELGTRFTAAEDGRITHIRFYKAPSETGSHVGRIWDSSGNLLASVSFTNETASGWQEQALATPLSIAANTEYLVSYSAVMAYPVTAQGLSQSVGQYPLGTMTAGGNGRFGRTLGAYPALSANSSNYYVDVKAEFEGEGTSQSLYSNQIPALSSSRLSYGSIPLEQVMDRGRPNFGAFSLLWTPSTSLAKLEGYSLLKYRLVWN